MRLRWTFRFRFIAFLMPVLLLANAVTYAGTTGLGGSGDPSCETNGVVFLDPQPLMDAVLEATQDFPVALDYSRTAAARIDGMTVVRVPGPDYGGAVVYVADDGTVRHVVTVRNTIRDGVVTSEIRTDGTVAAFLTLDEATGSPQEGWIMQDGQKIPLGGVPRSRTPYLASPPTFLLTGCNPGRTPSPILDEPHGQSRGSCSLTCLMPAKALPPWVVSLIWTTCQRDCEAVRVVCGGCAAGLLAGYLFEAGHHTGGGRPPRTGELL